MRIESIGIHPSVGDVFPPERLVEDLADMSQPVEVATSDAEVGEFDLLVTLAYEDVFTEVDWIHSIQAGVDRFPFETLADRAVVLTNSTGIHGDFVGETVAGYLLSFARRLHQASRNQSDRTWARPDWDEGFTVAGTTLCVVGLGTLGQGIAEKADALDIEVTGVKRTVEPVPNVARVHPQGELLEAIGEADFVALAVPLTDATEGLIGADEFEAMRSDAYLINVSRGPIVDTDALVGAIREGSIGGAALDVFDEEPLPRESPLWDLPNVFITPHIAGVSREYYVRVARLVRENLANLEAGSPLVNRVV